MKFEYKLSQVCSEKVEFDMDRNFVVTNIVFYKGCPGNAVGVAKLSDGRKAEELIGVLKGTCCGQRPTSCPDQFAMALESAKAQILANNAQNKVEVIL